MSGRSGDVHPLVAAFLRQAGRLEEVLDDRLHQIQTGRFTAANTDGTVEVTLDSHHQLVDVFITDGLLRKGVPAVQSAVNEAIAKANGEVDVSATDAVAQINAVVAQVMGRSAPIQADPR